MNFSKWQVPSVTCAWQDQKDPHATDLARVLEAQTCAAHWIKKPRSVAVLTSDMAALAVLHLISHQEFSIKSTVSYVFYHVGFPCCLQFAYRSYTLLPEIERVIPVIFSTWCWRWNVLRLKLVFLAFSDSSAFPVFWRGLKLPISHVLLRSILRLPWIC